MYAYTENFKFTLESEVTIFKLPLFDELITLCAYIDRIITCPGKHTLFELAIRPVH